MNSQNPSSTTVLDTAGNLGGGSLRNEGGAAEASQPGRGFAPPPPHAGNVSDHRLAAKLAAQEAKEAARRRKELNRQVWSDRFKRVHKTHYIAIGGVVCVGLGFLALKSILGTMLSIAEANSGDAAQVEQAPAPVIVQGIENPLELIDLSTQARWMIGLDSSGALVPNRSSAAVAELLSQLDLCALYIAQNDDASVAFLNEPAAGAYPVMAVGAQACMPVPTTPAPAETFTDPVPAPTVPGA
jgi:hypothetical protein